MTSYPSSSSLTGTPSLVDQATAILRAATDLQQRLGELALPPPTFAPGGRQDWHDASAHPDVLAARSALVDASHAMLQLALGPVDALAALAGPGAARLEVARTLDALGVAQAVPLDDDDDGIALPVLAGRLGVDAGLLYRQLRFAYLMGLFREPREGFVAHTAASAALPGVAPWLRVRQSPALTKGVDKLPEALKARGGEKEEGQQAKTATQLADSQGRGMWTILEEDYHPPGEGLRFFSAGMKSMMAGLLGESLTPYVHGFDWAALGAGTVIDVGGGNGHVEATLLPQIPAGVRFVVQDLPANEAPARALIAQHGAEDRIAFQSHDFFLPQPATAATTTTTVVDESGQQQDPSSSSSPPSPPPKAYLLSRVLHDWRDDECVAILRHLVPAMERHGTLLWLCERVLPDRPGQVPNHVEQQLRAPDLLMFTLFGGGERTLADWERVLARTDGRLRIRARRQPLDSVFSFMEIMLDGAGGVNSS